MWPRWKKTLLAECLVNIYQRLIRCSKLNFHGTMIHPTASGGKMKKREISREREIWWRKRRSGQSGKRLFWHRFPLTWLPLPAAICHLSSSSSSSCRRHHHQSVIAIVIIIICHRHRHRHHRRRQAGIG